MIPYTNIKQSLERKMVRSGFSAEEFTVETVGRYLCGENWELAKDPHSQEFIYNVMYNNPNSFYAVLWLQLTNN